MAKVKVGELSDTELLDLSREGDNDAFGVLWERHRRAGIVAARNVAPTLDPDDLVSGAFLKIFELLRDGRGPTGAFRPYLYRVISSLAADAYRSAEHSTTVLTEIPDLTEAGPWEDGAFDLNAAARAFESLPERWQAALWYSEVESLPPREIAPMLGLSANGVSALVARAKEGLQSAWVEAHVDEQLADEACRTTRGRLQRYQLSKLTAARRREVEAHLEFCAPCSAAAAEFRTLNKQLALVLAAIFLGGAPAAALMRSLGASNAAMGAGSTAVVPARGGSNHSPRPTAASSAGSAASSSAVSGAAATASGARTAGVGAGSGISVIAVTTTVALLVAAVGGILIANIVGSYTAGVPAAEASTDGSDAESNAVTDDEKFHPGKTESSARTETKEAAENAAPARDSTRSHQIFLSPPSPVAPLPTIPLPTIPPPAVPSNPPTDVIAGYQCFVPHLNTGEFELIGTASLPDLIEIGLNTSGGTAILQINVAADRSWTSGLLPDLDAFLNGLTTAEVRLLSGNSSSLWETAAVTQCAGTGPTVVTDILTSAICYVQPADIVLSGELSEYAVIFARHSQSGTITTVSDPLLEGVQDPSDSSVTWSGIFTGGDVAAPHFWWSPLPLVSYVGSVADYNAGNSGSFELRVQTPDGRTSTWAPIEQLISC